MRGQPMSARDLDAMLERIDRVVTLYTLPAAHEEIRRLLADEVAGMVTAEVTRQVNEAVGGIVRLLGIQAPSGLDWLISTTRRPGPENCG